MKKPLGELLLEEGVISRDELNDVLKIQEKSPLRIGQILQKKGIADETDVLSVLARQFGLAFEKRLPFKADAAFERIPSSLMEKYRMVPFEKKGRLIRIALADPEQVHYQDDLRRHLKGYRVEFVVSTETEINRIYHGHFQRAGEAARDVIEGLAGEEYGDLNLSDDQADLANDAPIIRMVNAILTQAVQERASDIHIEPYEKMTVVRYRIDGILHKRLNPPRAVHAGIVSRIKIESNLNIAENRLPQDGRFRKRIAGKEVDIRVSTIPSRHGERVVLRLLNKSDVRFDLDGMGLYPDLLRRIRNVMAQTNGILLVTGPTGSGKSTTLYGMLTELNEESRNIMTAEDPVEYEVPGISQTQVNEKIGLTFASALRTMLRQDPDIIMVGEIRDAETARIAIQAALTGHLVLSTLHTNDAPSAVTRLADMGIEPYLITSTVRGVIAQRLARRICPHCKTTYTPDRSQLLEAGLKPSELRGKRFARGKGCEHCSHTGFLGRLGIFEYMDMTPSVQRGVLQGKDSESLKEIAAKEGLITLLDYGRRKILDGETTPEEVLRVC